MNLADAPGVAARELKIDGPALRAAVPSGKPSGPLTALLVLGLPGPEVTGRSGAPRDGLRTLYEDAAHMPMGGDAEGEAHDGARHGPGEDVDVSQENSSPKVSQRSVEKKGAPQPKFTYNLYGTSTVTAEKPKLLRKLTTR